MVEHIQTKKTSLRSLFLKNRRSLSTNERRVKNDIIAHHVARILKNNHAPAKAPLNIGVYLPFPDEVNIVLLLLRILAESGISCRLAFPFFKKTGTPLGFYFPNQTAALIDFLQASAQAATWIYPNPMAWTLCANTELIRYWLIPGVAFTPSGYRIGFGGGFYDIWLSQHRGMTIGLAFDIQITNAFEPEAFDMPVDYVATESRVYVRNDVVSPDVRIGKGDLIS